MKKGRVLTELDWERVFRARCKSKQGQALTDDERALVEAAWRVDRKRYAAMDADVFDVTAEAIGSYARAKRRPKA